MIIFMKNIKLNFIILKDKKKYTLITNDEIIVLKLIL